MSNFPDPSPSGSNAAAPASSIYGIVIPSTIILQSPAFQAAERSCKGLLSGAAAAPPITKSQEQAALATARCMREHGLPNWPDPTFSDGEIGISTGGYDPQSPAFKRAQAACGRTPPSRVT